MTEQLLSQPPARLGPAPAAIRTDLARIQSLRALFLQEANRQIRYDACHARGWSDSYLLTADGVEVGYGSVKADHPRDATRDRVFEFYLLPPFRRHASALFGELLSASGAARVECQSNDPLLSAMLFEFAHHISADVMLFEADAITSHTVPGAVVRPSREGDQIFDHRGEPSGDWVVELGGEIVAAGGFLLHYNPPFADLYMEVAPGHRRRGIGTLLVQELIRACYLAGRVPAARTGVDNRASRATLTKAGLRQCGFMLMGEVRGQTTR